MTAAAHQVQLDIHAKRLLSEALAHAPKLAPAAASALLQQLQSALGLPKQLPQQPASMPPIPQQPQPTGVVGPPDPTPVDSNMLQLLE